MRTKDEVHISGRFQLLVKQSGNIIERIDDHNMIVSNAKVVMASLVGGDGTGKHVAKIAIGTNATPPTAEDTAITGAFQKDMDSVTYPAVGQVQFSWSIGSAEANGLAISEFGLICADGSLFARKIRSGNLTKASDITLEGKWTISF